MALGMLLYSANALAMVLQFATHRLWSAVLTIPLWTVEVTASVLALRLTRRPNLIVVARRRDSPSFLRRNKDQLLVAALSALLGAVVAVVLTFVVSRM
jgi:hypothetical protein